MMLTGRSSKLAGPLMTRQISHLISCCDSLAPGDPTKQGLGPATLTWTFVCDEEFMVTAIRLPAPEPTWGFIVTEAAR